MSQERISYCGTAEGAHGTPRAPLRPATVLSHFLGCRCPRLSPRQTGEGLRVFAGHTRSKRAFPMYRYLGARPQCLEQPAPWLSAPGSVRLLSGLPRLRSSMQRPAASQHYSSALEPWRFVYQPSPAAHVICPEPAVRPAWLPERLTERKAGRVNNTG